MNITGKLAWMIFISRRFARVDRQGRSALTAFLSALGIAFGVMTLVVVMAVMNGFQLGYIESILEISSYHVRVSPKTLEAEREFLQIAQNDSYVSSVTPFSEAQALVVGKNSRQQAAMLRFVPDDILQIDKGFASQISIVSGDFDISDEQAVIGYSVAQTLGLKVGDSINILAMSGSSDVELISEARTFIVSGIFVSDYAEINSNFIFFSLDTGNILLGENTMPLYGIKLNNSNHDTFFLANIQKQLHNFADDLITESWRSYNSAFFGALRIEKNLLMMLVFLIFIVVGVNIFNSMRRMVFERREEIAVLSALGAQPVHIQAIFMFQGFTIGFFGAVSGLLLGMLLSVQIDTVFIIISKTVYYVQYFFVWIFNRSTLHYVTENPMFSFYAQIPARPEFAETALITLFGVLSALTAAWVAGRKILKLSVAEVLRYE
ncbi:MAG: ABC transporter permease [Spirochaetales bacterium]